MTEPTDAELVHVQQLPPGEGEDYAHACVRQLSMLAVKHGMNVVVLRVGETLQITFDTAAEKATFMHDVAVLYYGEWNKLQRPWVMAVSNVPAGPYDSEQARVAAAIERVEASRCGSREHERVRACLLAELDHIDP